MWLISPDDIGVTSPRLVGHQVASDLIRVKGIVAYKTREARSKHLDSADCSRYSVLSDIYSDTEVDSWYKVLVGELIQDRPASVRVGAADSQI